MVNKQNLQIKINSLVALKASTWARHESILGVLESLNYIRDENVIDRDTNLPMTETRRQEIYDACVAAADELIQQTFPPTDNPSDDPNEGEDNT